MKIEMPIRRIPDSPLVGTHRAIVAYNTQPNIINYLWVLEILKVNPPPRPIYKMVKRQVHEGYNDVHRFTLRLVNVTEIFAHERIFGNRPAFSLTEVVSAWYYLRRNRLLILDDVSLNPDVFGAGETDIFLEDSEWTQLKSLSLPLGMAGDSRFVFEDELSAPAEFSRG